MVQIANRKKTMSRITKKKEYVIISNNPKGCDFLLISPIKNGNLN